MTRCIKTTNLEVYYIRTEGGNDVDNAVVLCQRCYFNTNGNATHPKIPTSFPPTVIEKAIHRAKGRCECKSDIQSCH